MKLSKSDMQKIQHYFAAQEDITAVYLYGSFAHGTSHKRSDLDIAVLFNGKVNLYERLGSLYSNFPELSIKAEPEVRELDLNKSPIFLRNVVKSHLIYSSDEIKRIRFEVAVLNLVSDTQHLRNIRNFYVKKSLKEGTYGYRLLHS